MESIICMESITTMWSKFFLRPVFMKVWWVVAAAGLGQYVEALVLKGGAEFNVRHS